jgi:hypothetical protein
MAWSIFREGGGKGSAATWAKTLIQRLGVPDTPAMEQFVYDWEVSEGGGGKFNPLNQGLVPGHPELTTSGIQFGGGAADYASWDAGFIGAVDYIAHMSNYTNLYAHMKAGDAAGARAALIASPWAASHYNNGRGFSNEALPGQSNALPGYTGSGGTTAVNTSVPNPLSIFNPFQWVMDQLKISDFGDLVERAGLILLGTIIIIVALVKFTNIGEKVTVAQKAVE